MFVDCGGKARAACFPLSLRNPTGGLYRLLTTGTLGYPERVKCVRADSSGRAREDLDLKNLSVAAFHVRG